MTRALMTRWTYAAATACGPVRTRNEDAVAVGPVILSGAAPTIASGVIDPGADALFVVADGMGGHPSGDLASHHVASSLAAYPPCCDPASCRAAVRRANIGLHAAMRRAPETLGMGSTVVGLLIRGARLAWFNVGDSRLYRWRPQDGLIQLSTDDVAATKPGALSAALGGQRDIAPVEPHAGTEDLTPGERLLLCSDGLTHVLSDADIASILGSGHDVASISGRLVQMCLDKGAPDNVSTVVVG